MIVTLACRDVWLFCPDDMERDKAVIIIINATVCIFKGTCRIVTRVG